MPTDAQITFSDHMGRFYARRFSFPPMVGRLIGYLAVCDPPNPTIGEWSARARQVLENVGARASPASGCDAPRECASRRSRWEWTSRSTRRCGGWRRRASRSSATLRWSAGRHCWRCRRSPSSSSNRCRSSDRSGKRDARRSSRQATCPKSALANGGAHDRYTSTRRRRDRRAEVVRRNGRARRRRPRR